MDSIQRVLKDSNYRLDLFKDEEIEKLQKRVFCKTGREHLRCIVRGKDIQLKPEEIVRQLYAARLIEQYGYSENRLGFEYPVSFGRKKKAELKAKIQALFDQAKSGWPGVLRKARLLNFPTATCPFAFLACRM